MPRVGTEVRVERRKWPDRPHYGVTCVVLGTDEHGTWLGSRAGATVSAPEGRSFVGQHDVVFCLPEDDWYLLHHFDGHSDIRLYVDICTPHVWSGSGATTVDLDFDVIVWNEVRGGGVELVDEDEFEDHRATYGYPDDLVEAARRAASEVLARVERSEPPFDGAAALDWLAVLRSLT